MPDELCVELKSLKLYIWSFRDRGAFHEAVTNEIANDLAGATSPRFLRLTGKFNVRGGIYTTVVVEQTQARLAIRPRQFSCPEALTLIYGPKIARKAAISFRCTGEKLAGIIPRPANRPPSGSGPGATTHMPTKRAAAKPAKPKKVEKPKLTAKKPAAKACRSQALRKAAPAKAPAAKPASCREARPSPRLLPPPTPLPRRPVSSRPSRKTSAAARPHRGYRHGRAEPVPAFRSRSARAASSEDGDDAIEAGSLLAGPRNVTPYITKRGEAYMNKVQLEHFRNILNGWKRDLMEEVDRTVSHMKDEAANFPDPERPRHAGRRVQPRAAHPRPRAQADPQDRRSTEARRGRLLWLLPRDRRGNRREAPRSASGGHAHHRSPGTPRAPRTPIRRPRRPISLDAETSDSSTSRTPPLQGGVFRCGA